MNVFLCFSGENGRAAAISILYHLKNYGVPTWYDYHQHRLGDDKNINFAKAIHSSKYTILIITEGFFTRSGVIEELVLIKQRVLDNKLHVFPIFFEVLAEQVPPEHDWINGLIYNEVDRKSGTLFSCNQIVEKYLEDIICENKYINRLEEYTSKKFIGKNINQDFVKQMLQSYIELDHANINARLTVLYSLLLYFSSVRTNKNPNYLLARTIIIQLYKYTKLNLNFEFKELLMAEKSLIIILNELS